MIGGIYVIEKLIKETDRKNNKKHSFNYQVHNWYIIHLFIMYQLIMYQFVSLYLAVQVWALTASNGLLATLKGK